MASEGLTIALLIEAKNRAQETLDKIDESFTALSEKAKSMGESVSSSFTSMEDSMQRFAGVSQEDIDAFDRVAEAAGLSTDEIDRYKMAIAETGRNAEAQAMADEQAAAIDRVGKAAGMSATEIQRLQAENDKLIATEREAAAAADEQAASTEEAGVASEEGGGKFGKMGKSAAVAGLAIAGIAYETIKMASQYQTSMDTVQSRGDLTAKQAKALSSAFLATAGSSTESAQEIAAAYGPVAGEFESLSGKVLTTAQTMQVMKASTDLADASGESLTVTTKTLADTMTVYHQSAGQAATDSNTLWNTARRLGVSVSELGSSLQRIEPRIVGSGMSLKQTSGFMLELSSVAGKGRQAMRLAGQAIQQIITPSAAAQKDLAQMGVSLQDSNGKFIGMQAAIGKLHAAFAKLPGPAAAMAAQQQVIAKETELATMKTEAQSPALKAQETRLTASIGVLKIQAAALTHTSVMQSLFGRQANIMATVISGGTQRFIENTKAVSKSGEVQSAAKLQAQSFAGQMKTMKATISDLSTTIGMALIPIVDTLMRLFAKFVKPLVHLITTHQKMFTVIIMVVGGIAALIVAINLGVKAYEAASAAFEAGGKVISKVMDTNPWILAIMALIVVIVLIATHWKEVSAMVKRYVGDMWTFIKRIFDDVMGFIKSVISFIQKHWQGILEILIAPFAPVLAIVLAFHNQILNFFKEIWHGIEDVWKLVTNAGKDAWNAITSVFSDAGTMLYQVGRDIISGLWHGISSMIGDLIKGVESVGSSVVGAVKSIFKVFSPSLVFSDIGVNLMLGLGQGVQKGAASAALPAITSASRAITQQMTTSTVSAPASRAAGGNQVTIDLRGAQVMSDNDIEMLTAKIGHSVAKYVVPMAGVRT